MFQENAELTGLGAAKLLTAPIFDWSTPPVSNRSLAFDQMPLPNFVQAVYGLILKKSYSMDPAVASRKDLVTLRASSPQTPAQIENSARLLLKTYGVAVSDLGAGNYRVTPDNAQSGYAPEILRGRAMPDVPLALRPIYQLVELQAVRSSELLAWLPGVMVTAVTPEGTALKVRLSIV